jgi:crotonobetainyl-CoA:carnitine CoA-transferase CaiB-like acyl-CoA transferase
MRVGVAISDTAAGMFLGQGILLALLHREQTGRGQWVHTSLLESMLCKLDFQAARYTMTGDVPGQEGNHHPTAVPTGAFESSDGLVNIAASRNRMWVSLCTALDAQNLLANQDYADARSRAKHRERLRADLGKVVRCFTTADLVEKLNAVGVPCGPINTIGEAFEDPRGVEPGQQEELGSPGSEQAVVSVRTGSQPGPASCGHGSAGV